MKHQEIKSKISDSKKNIEKILFRSGKILRKFFHQGVTRSHKGVVDFITEADTASEKCISENLKKYFPDDSFMCEEGSRAEGTSGFLWCVDPLDGTTNFSHKVPFYSVSIGLCLQTDDRLEPVHGFIYLPHYDNLYRGGVFFPSIKNKKRIYVSKAATLDQALIVTGFPYNRREIFNSLQKNLFKVINTAQGIRRTGSACLDLCFTAEGRFDGYYECFLKPWDLAAGAAIVTGAGGSVKNYRGKKFDVSRGEIVAGPEKLVNELVKLGLE